MLLLDMPEGEILRLISKLLFLVVSGICPFLYGGAFGLAPFSNKLPLIDYLLNFWLALLLFACS